MRSSTSKQVWNVCEIIGNRLEISKFQVNKYLYSELKSLGWIKYFTAPTLLLDLNLVKALPGYKKMLEAQKAMQEEEKRKQLEELQKLEKGNVVKQNCSDEVNTAVTEPEAQIRIAMWFIRKLGSIDMARKAMEAASMAMQALAQD